MFSLRRILRNYNVFLEVLKFALENNDNIEFKRFSLVSTLNQLLKGLEERIDKIFPNSMKSEPRAYEDLLEDVFKDKIEKYRPWINTNNKKDLVKRFEFLMNLTDSSEDMWDGVLSLEVIVIDDEIRRVITFLQPLLVVMSNQDLDSK